MPKALFLCTGNYYRSRFAELLFNSLAARQGLDWTAESRGLALERGLHNVGPISKCVLSTLTQLGVQVGEEHRLPLTVSELDLASAAHIVALKDAEHRPLVRERFPTWEERIEFWHIHDVDCATPETALVELEADVVRFVARLRESVVGKR
jgi:protein-tyrosine phosphatase